MKKLDDVLMHLSKLTPCGSPHSEFYFKMRDIHQLETEHFINSLIFDNALMTPIKLVKKHVEL